jgi:glycosyltransferase involved in cell wall biosynthesis
MTVHQFVPVLLPGDAVGNCARGLHGWLRTLDPASRIFVEDFAHSDQEFATPLVEARLGSSDVLLFHYATFSPRALEVASLAPTVLWYHNITPEEYFRAWDLPLAVAQRRARWQLRALAREVIGAFVDSRFNGEELRALGVERVAVPGLLAAFDLVDRTVPTPKAALLEEYRLARGNPEDWLFVGRLVPNKAQERLIAAFAAYRRLTGEDATLTLIGRPFRPAYLEYLRDLVHRLGLARRVHLLTGGVSAEVLADHYRAARTYVSLSSHEGFGAPLLEAMAAGLPVVALARAAVAETVADAGLLIAEDDPATVAAAASLVARAPLRDELVARGRARVAEFTSDAVFARVRTGLLEVAGVRL